MTLQRVSNQRIDYQRMPNGATKAILTVTLSGLDRPLRFESIAAPGEEIGARRTSTDKLSDAQSKHRVQLSWLSLANADKRPRGWSATAPYATQLQWWNAIGKDKRGQYKVRYAAIMDNAPAAAATDVQKNTWWHRLSKNQRGKFRDPYESDFLEDVGKAIKSVASSKVLKVAAAGLAVAAPALGPLAPAALAASAGLGVAGKLASAGNAAKKGLKAAAAALTSQAMSDAARIAPAGAASLLADANRIRHGVERVIAKTAPSSPRPTKSKPAPSSSSSSVLQLAKAGRVRSNQAGAVSPAALLAAAASGRVFWVT